MAYVRKVKNGWRVEVERAGVRVSATRATKAEAMAWGVAEEAALLAGARGEYPRKTLVDAVDRYRREVTDKKAKGRPEVARADNLRFDAWLRDFPGLAAKVFHEITTEDLARWRDARLEKVSESSVLRELQQLLVRAGYNVGKIDGVMGQQSRSAVKAVQIKYGLPADSWPTAELLARMRGTAPSADAAAAPAPRAAKRATQQRPSP